MHVVTPLISKLLKMILDAFKMLKKISWGAAYKPWGLLHYRAKSKMAAKNVQGLYKSYIEKNYNFDNSILVKEQINSMLTNTVYIKKFIKIQILLIELLPLVSW